MQIAQIEREFKQVLIEFVHIYHGDIPPRTKALNTRTHDGTCGIVIPVSGQAIYRLDGYEYLLRRGVILHAGNAMRLDKEVVSEENWKYYLIHYRCMNESPLPALHFALKYEEVRITELLVLLREGLLPMSEVDGDALLVKAKLYELIAKVLTLAYDFDDGIRVDMLNVLCQYIDSHYAQISHIEDVAQAQHISYKTMLDAFQESKGVTPKQYLISCRIDRAKLLLTESDMPVSAVSQSVGYGDALYFSRIFKRLVGVTPSGYRAQACKENTLRERKA